MPSPSHPQLPLCSQFAALPGRYMFAMWLDNLLTEQPIDSRQSDAQRLKGMLAAYLELELITNAQHMAMCDELTAFAFGATP
ncbi:hypothetical protein IB239_01835 [Pseudomonas sp. PDM12]|uniref:hypothetical protein n=1 Tax=Pseudomonas sp. PDM12 TaxID=2769260 RepID=UPI00177B79F6|nr:hypothetical protein [Pseudomonas sp. PDM12]MBD9653551.1 hypothetical protein [Pseudomonas sp. PDM12]